MGVGQAAETIKFGHVGQPGSLMGKTAKEFAKRANEKLGDKAEVRVYGSSQFGSDTQMLRKLKLGTIDMSLPSTVMSSVAPSFALFEMPFLVNDREHMAVFVKASSSAASSTKPPRRRTTRSSASGKTAFATSPTTNARSAARMT